MYIEKRFKREDKSEIMLRIDFGIGFNSTTVRLGLLIRAKGKRKFICPINTEGYEYRGLSMPQRHAFVVNKLEQYLTPDEIRNAIKDGWESIMPDYKKF